MIHLVDMQAVINDTRNESEAYLGSPSNQRLRILSSEEALEHSVHTRLTLDRGAGSA